MAVAAIVSTALSAQQTFTSNPNLAINDNVSQSDSINVSGITAPTSILVEFRIDHTWDSDLSIWLVPAGVTDPGVYTGTPPAGVIDLCSGNGGSGDNFGTGATAPFTYTRISSATDPVNPGTINITAGAAPFTAGVYIPEGTTAFNALYGAAQNGTWVLGIADTATGDPGVLLSWRLTFVSNAGDPEIDVTDPNSAPVASGATINLGNTDTGGATNYTFTIDNLGATQNLTVSNIAAASSGVGNCSVTANPTLVPAGPIAPAGSATFDVAVTPSAIGAYEFTVTITNNDADEGTFTIIVQGTGADPNPAIAQPTSVTANPPLLITELIDDPAPSGDEYIELTNVSGAALDTTGWQFVFYDASTTPQYSITLTSGVLAAGATWVVCDNPSPGTANPVADQYCGTNMGSMQNKGVVILDASNNIIDAAFFGSMNPAGITNPVTIGSQWVGATAANPTFATDSAKRTGTSDHNDATDWSTPAGSGNSLNVVNTGLTLPFSQSAGAAISGTDPNWVGTLLVGDNLGVTFTATDSNPSQTLNYTITVTGGTLTGAAAGFNESFPFTPAGGTSPHDASLTGTALAQGSIQLTIQVSDGTNTDTITYTVNIVAPQEMDVLRGATAVADGGTDTGVNIAAAGSNLTYTIQNTGGLDLNLTGTPLVSVTAGTNVSTVTVTTDPNTPVAGGGNTTFVINVVPTTASVGGDAYDFTVSIDNNDANENPYNFTVSGNAYTNQPPVVTVGAGNWVDAGGGLFTLTLNPGAAINDTLTVTDPTPDNMTVDVVTAAALTGITGQPADITTPTAGPLSLTWTGTADGSNTPGNYDWTIDINDGVSTTNITARIIIVDVAPQHTPATGISGDGSVGTPYLTTYAENDPASLSVNLANVSDANTGQNLNLSTPIQTGGPTGGSGFTFSLVGGVLSVAPSATLVAADVGTQVFSMDVDDGPNTVTINVTITVLGNSGAITFTNTSPLAGGTVGVAYTTVTLTATGGTGPYTYSLANGTSLPAGLSLSATGDITGTPTTAGTVNFSVRAVDSLSDSAVASFQITISAPSSGSGGGGGDDGGCSTGGEMPYSWMLLLGLLSLGAVAIRMRKA